MKSNRLSACILLSVFAFSFAGSSLAQPAGLAARRAAGNKSSDSIVYQDWTDAARGRTLPVKIYLPKTGSAPYPVVIFSHGLGGSREAAAYAGDAWSQHGYLCVFVQHPGSDSSVWQNSRGGRDEIMKSLKGAANGGNLRDRAADITFVLDELEKRDKNDQVLGHKLDLKKIALGGHSFGAGTTLAIAGQNFPGVSVADSRVKCALYFCPPVVGAKLDPKKAYGSIKIPGLLLTGTEDNSPIGDTKAEDRRIPYDNIMAPHQYLVNFIGANHATFGGGFRGGINNEYIPMISKVSTEFLDANLKDDAASWKWLDGPGIKDYLGEKADFEHK